MSAIGDIVVNLRANIAQYQQAMAQSKTATASLQSSVGSLNRVMAGLGVGVSVAGAYALGKHMVTLAANAEKTAVSFRVLTGSAETAQQIMRDITKFGAETPFESPELADTTKKLLAYGFTVKEVIPVLTRLGDLSSGMGQRIGELADMYGKARIQGRLAQEDINQFVGRGINIMPSLAKQFGIDPKDMSALRKLVENGAVSFQNLRVAIESLAGPGGQFNGMMKELSATAAGQWSNVKDNVDEQLRKMGEEILPHATEAMQSLLTLLESRGPSIVSGFGAAIRGTVEAFENLYLIGLKTYYVMMAIAQWNAEWTPAFTDSDKEQKAKDIADLQSRRQSVANAVDKIERGQIGRANVDELEWIEKSAPPEQLELIKKRRDELLNAAGSSGGAAGGIAESLKKAADATGPLNNGLTGTAKAATEAAKAVADMQKQASDWKEKAATFGMGDKDKAQRGASLKYFEDVDKIKAAGLPWDKEREAIAKLQSEYGNLTRAIDDYYAKEDAAEKAKKAADATKDFADKIQGLKDKLNGVTDAQKAFQEALKAGVPLEQAKALRQEYEKIEGLNRIKDQRDALKTPQQKYAEDLEKLGELTKGQKYGKDALKLGEWTEGRKQLQQAAVGGMLDSLKTPMQKASEAIADIRKWENVGALTKGQADLLVQKQIEEANKTGLGDTPQSPAAQARGSAAAWSSIVGAMNEDTQAKQLAALNRIANNTAPSAASKPKQMKI